jgi:hypothetical protein
MSWVSEKTNKRLLASSSVGGTFILSQPVEQKAQPNTHESSSDGARPSSAAPIDQNRPHSYRSWTLTSVAQLTTLQ